MLTADFDLAIVGAGPAGSSAAITAARLGARVVLLEARDFPRQKVCGEFVSAEALGVLTGLLRDLPSAKTMFERAPAIGRMRLLFGSRIVEASVSPPALSIPRYDLDWQMWEAAQHARVETRANWEVSASEGDGPFRLQAPSGEITARALIVAAGRWSQFTPDRTLPPGPKWIGLKAHFRETDPSPCTDLYIFRDGYCGVQPIAEDMVNACAMVRSDKATSLPEVFRLHPQLSRRSASWSAVTQPVSTAPLIYRLPQPVCGNTVMAGDAAAFIDPFVGDGISIALRGGEVAARCICQFLLGTSTLADAVASYEREYSSQFAPLLLAASRVRSLFSLPEVTKPLVFELLRFPGLIPFLIRKTRTG